MRVPLPTVLREWGRLGLVAFGGPPAHVALLRELVVDRRGWIGAREFEDANAACQLLPGPASTQLAIYCAQRVGGLPGALIGGLAFIMPGLLMVLAIAALVLGDAPPEWILGIGAGAGAAVVVVVAQAGIVLGRSSLAGRRDARAPAYIAAGFAATVLAGPYVVLVLLAAGLLELAWQRRSRVALHAWPIVIAAAAALPGLAWTALKVGALSYGGGFVIIPLMQEDAVERHGWMTDTEFLNAVAFGQITPGPVVHTVALVGWAAAGLLGALLAAAIAFAPSFLAIALGGERFGQLRENRSARAFLDGAGPAAVGAILGAAVPLAAGVGEWWQVAVLAARRRAAGVRPAAAVGAGRRRTRRTRRRRRRRPAALRGYLLRMDLQEEATDVLARLIRFDTVNPPGNERACQEWLKGYLEDAGLECELLCAEDPERPNLVARLQGESEGPVLGYLSHVDTVLADAADWRHDPWSGEVHDGALWGRGAIDMKSQTAAEAVAAAHLARQGWRPARGELKVISVVDEEARRPARRPVAHGAAPGRGPRRLAAQRGGRCGDALRRPPPLRGLLRREGHDPLPRDRARPGRPRLGPGTRRQRAAQARAARSSGSAAAVPATTSSTSRALSWRRSARTPATRRARSSACAPSSRASPRCSSRRSAPRSPRR